MSNAKNKIILSGTIILVLMFVHLVNIFNACNYQVINNNVAISAFNG